LGGWRTRAGRLRNIMITFGLSGLWHGANWTFISWGVLHGLFHVPLVRQDRSADMREPHLRDLPRILGTFMLVTVAWVFFRSDTVGHAATYLHAMATHIAWSPGALLLHVVRPEMLWISVLLAIEWFGRTSQHPLELLPRHVPVRWAVYLGLIAVVLVTMDLRTSHAFIYFQF